MTIISDFLSRVQSVYKTGAATEHSYRPALEALFNSLDEGVSALNEPKRVECGAPDFIIQRGEIVIGHVEAKDLDIGLRGMKNANKEQQNRYRKALQNLIYTNCLDWDFYRNGDLIASVTIADYQMGIQPNTDQFGTLENLLRDFIAQRPQTITSPRVLAEMMAGKAGLIKDILRNALTADKDSKTELAGQYTAFREHLIHDIEPEEFADIYAETIAYGMFAARLHDKTLETFSRSEALELLPKSNPFLRSLFGYIAGPDLDERIKWIIDDLANVFQAANVKKLMEGFGKLTGRNDPFLHFYETFLTAYNPAKRKARGVWYTPEAVVNFIVRAVDEVLQTEFCLADGLADTSKVTIDWDTGQTDRKGKRVTIRKEVHRVQILDPATGTGTFLAEVIKQIAPKVKGVAEGMWSQYIESDLIPRLHGFELLMASYAMCHMKLDMILSELGYHPTSAPPRLSVYLTNSLEEGEPANQTLPFAQWLSNEVKQANTIKRDMPIMCVIGNPPYSVSSQNKGGWITSLVDDYKSGLTEKKTNLDDDYIKFLRYAQHLIDKNGEGIVGMITNNSFIDGITHRRMRESLLSSFCSIYVFNLHGSAVREERAPDGSKDENVFDIMQGVSISIFVKKRGKSGRGNVYYSDLYGKRQEKYDALWLKTLSPNIFSKLIVSEPAYFFAPKDFSSESEYKKGFSIRELMALSNSGIKTDRDSLFIDFDKSALSERIEKLLSGHFESDFEKKFNVKNSSSYKVTERIKGKTFDSGLIKRTHFRPFDFMYIYYDPQIISRPAHSTSQHLVRDGNIALLVPRQAQKGFHHVLVSDALVDVNLLSNAGMFGAGYTFPLYILPSEQDLDKTRRVNFDAKLYKKLQSLAIHADHSAPNEVQVFDYIYGVLHCPAYRERYAEFLKIDFPRIPWPATSAEFWDVSDKGAQLRRIHLMDTAAIGATPYPFKGDGNSVVDKPHHDGGKFWINKTQYFDDAPEVAWGFYIGGYQPAQKWLKDRKGRALSFEDVKHYQRILKTLSETDRIMQTITMTLETE